MWVLRHIYPKYACSCCKDGVTSAEPAANPIERCLAGPGLLAYVMVSKFSEHLPLYRQQDVLGRHGIFLARSTLCGWMAQCAQLLRPLVELMRQRVVQSDVINADETPVRVLDRTRNSCASAEPHLAGHVTIVAWPKGGGEAWRNGCATAARSSTGGRSWHAGDQAGFPCGPTASSIGSRNRLSTGGDARFRGATAPGPDSCRCALSRTPWRSTTATTTPSRSFLPTSAAFGRVDRGGCPPRVG